MVKNLPGNAGEVRDTGLFPGLGRSLERAQQPTPVFLPGKSTGTEEPGRLHSIESHRVGHNRSDLAQ